eukprot:9192675-Alexandrium_andersonii.AAC.1
MGAQPWETLTLAESVKSGFFAFKEEAACQLAGSGGAGAPGERIVFGSFEKLRQKGAEAGGFVMHSSVALITRSVPGAGTATPGASA